MNDSNSASPEIAALRLQVQILLAALIVVTGTLAVYLFRQASVEGKAIVQAKQVVNTYNQNQASIAGFVQNVVAYGEKHPDFAQSVLKKYGIAPIPGIPANTVAPMPAPKK